VEKGEPMSNQRAPRIFRINTGSCGACDVEIEAAVAAGHLALAASPLDADALLLTGPITADARPAFDAILAETSGVVPLIAVGRCAIDGHPYGRGGLAERPEIDARLKIDGSPPSPTEIAEAVRRALARRPAKARAGERRSSKR
jgi:Ni,Fe-hydrogenase III small subunit